MKRHPSLQVGGPGTYVVGASVRPNRIELKGPDFNAYLKEDGILDVLEARTTNHQLDNPARERPSKHVKAVAEPNFNYESKWATLTFGVR
jgi:hypothetical protein